MRIWVTRAQPGATATARRLRSLGFDPLVAPLLQVRDLAGDAPDMAGVGALAFTSANGVTAFAARSAARDLPVFAVGAATALAARARGFSHILSADGDVAALARAILTRTPSVRGVVLHPGPVEPAGDLVGALGAHGVPARQIAVYETGPRAPEPEVAALIPELHGVLLHSPKAARALAAWVEAHPAPRLAAFCLSAAVAAPLAGGALASVRASPQPNEAALLALVVRFVQPTAAASEDVPDSGPGPEPT